MTLRLNSLEGDLLESVYRCSHSLAGPLIEVLPDGAKVLVPVPRLRPRRWD